MLVAATIERHGYDGLVLATVMAGLILMALGFLRLGTYIKYIPHPVIVGFTAGIALIILSSQLRDLFGLTLAGKEPAAPALGRCRPQLCPGPLPTSVLRPCGLGSQPHPSPKEGRWTPSSPSSAT